MSATILARTIYDSAVRRNVQPLWTLPVLVAGKFDDAMWARVADAAGCGVPDVDTRKAVVGELREMVR